MCPRLLCKMYLTVITIILVTGLTSLTIADSSNFSGLEGKDLQPADALVSLGLGLLARGEGNIDSIQVVEDRAESLSVKITFSKLESDDSIMSVSAVDKRIKPISGIESAKLSLSSKEGEVTATLKVAAGVPEGSKADQVHLLIQVSRKDSKPYLMKAFRCPKKWEKLTAPEHMVITAVAEPVKGGATEKLTKPVKVIGPIYSPTIFKPKAIPVTKTDSQAKPAEAMAIKPVLITAIKKDASAPKPANDAAPATGVVAVKKFVLMNPKVVAGLPSADKQTGAKGPSAANRIPLFELVKTEVPGLDAASVTDIKGELYGDLNTNSGYYYYLPRGFYLDWSEESGYGLRFLFGQQDSEGSGNVKVQASLTSGVDNFDVTLISRLLEQYCKANNLPAFKKLRAFPFDAPPEGISVSLKGDLSPFNVSPDKVSINGITEVGDKIQILFATDDRNLQDFQVALTQGLGLSGSMAFAYSDGSGSGGVKAPANVSIKLRDPQSFANRLFKRGAKFRNPSPYPVKLKYVHVLAVEESGDHCPIVYSYRLRDSKTAAGDENGVVVPAGASAAINADGIPSWLDSTALRMWVDYSVMADAEADQMVLDKVTGGVTSTAQSQVNFWTLQTALSSVGAEMVLVSVKSKYFDPAGSKETTKTLKLDKDGSTFTLGPLYLGNTKTDGSVTLFNYKLNVIKPDGTSKESAQWKNGTSLEITIGPAQLREVLGITADSSGTPADSGSSN